jgi:16S rRNA (cytidine1402-2'-O)-methyltransferase
MKMPNKGSIIMIPCPIVEGKVISLPPETIGKLHDTQYFIVERAKTARHFIKSTNHPLPISNLVIFELNDNQSELHQFLNFTLQGHNIGVISEAGCPGIADPGADVVAWAHLHQIKVIPLVGPSSILMALMASGMNGQNFTFNGYLSNKKPELIQQLKGLESKVVKSAQTQIWIETPYRNRFMIETILQTLHNNTLLCIACDINGLQEFIQSKKVMEWRKVDLNHIQKVPCIYLIG